MPSICKYFMIAFNWTSESNSPIYTFRYVILRKHQGHMTL